MNRNISGRIFFFSSTKQSDEDTWSIHSTSEPFQDECVPLRHTYILAVSIAPALVLLENFVFLVSVILYRQKLKHNNVYTYVTSALLANILTSSWALYHFLNYYFGIESAVPTPWWAFRKVLGFIGLVNNMFSGLTAGFSLILCGNIGLLIYALEESTYVVGRLGLSARKNNNNLNPKFRMHKAFCLIAIAWVMPVLYGLMAMTPWSCTRGCTCTLHYESGTHICPDTHCSRLYTPMSKSYLFVIVCMWAIECGVLLGLLCRSACIAVRDRTPKTRASSQNIIFNVFQCSQIPASHTFLLLLLGLFFLCTSPVMILLAIDWANPNLELSNMVVNVTVPLPLIYCLVSPILLTRRLSGMKSALTMTLSLNWLSCKNKSKETSNIIKKRRRMTSEEALSTSRDDSCDVV